ncbi:MAG: VWA domain-containing protein [Acidobacteriota bacterium]
MQGIALRSLLLLTLVVPLLGTPDPIQAQEASAENGPESDSATGEAAAAAETSERVFFDQIDVDLTNLEVVVTDKKGRPVTGLTSDDFEIYVDGRKVDISHFAEVREPTPEPSAEQNDTADELAAPAEAPADAPTGDEPPDEAGDSTTEDGSDHLVIFVDNVNISPQNRKLLFVELRRFLEQRWRPANRVMLVTLGRKVEVALPFSADREQVLATLDELEKQSSHYALADGDRRMFLNRLQRASLRAFSPRTGGGQQTGADLEFTDAVRVALELGNSVRRLSEQRYQRLRATIASLGELCGTLGGMSGRKALIYLSDGLPMRPADSLIEAFTGKYETWVIQNQDDMRQRTRFPEAPQDLRRVMTSIGSTEFDLGRNLQQLTARASENRVAFYPISNNARTSNTISAEDSGAGLAAGTGSGSMNRNAQAVESFTRDASLLQLAQDTGGQALIRSANLGELFARVTQDFNNYYSLAFDDSPAYEINELATEEERAAAAEEEAKRRESRRELKVKALRKDLVVRHGKGFQTKSWRERLGDMTRASALFEVESNPLQVALDPGEQVREGERFRVPIMLTIPFEQIRMVFQGEHYMAQLTALVLVHNEKDGGISEPQRIDFPIKILGSRIMEAARSDAGYVLELEMGGGPKRVAVGVRDHFGRTESTVNLDLVVGQGTG